MTGEEETWRKTSGVGKHSVFPIVSVGRKSRMSKTVTFSGFRFFFFKCKRSRYKTLCGFALHFQTCRSTAFDTFVRRCSTIKHGVDSRKEHPHFFIMVIGGFWPTPVLSEEPLCQAGLQPHQLYTCHKHNVCPDGGTRGSRIIKNV